MPDVLALVTENGHQVIGIPPRATSYLQPLDVSINAPFKNAVKDAYEQLIGQDELPLTAQGNIKRASYDCVLDWVRLATDKLSVDSIESFIACGISWQRNACEFNSRIATIMQGASMPIVQTDTEAWWEVDGPEDADDFF